jgi:uncharacterized protein YggU (UPF0235/DUF167 family)
VKAGQPPLVQDGSDVLLAIRVHPRASRNQLVVAGPQPTNPAAHPVAPAARAEDLGPDSITLRVTAPPAEGAANAACRSFLADLLGIAQSRITIVRGGTARRKLLRIRDADAAHVLARLQSPQ